MGIAETKFDVVVIGSGISGSIMALILSRLGFQVAVVDRAKHPRFAIGESSTPVADAYLKELSDSFGLPELLPLSAFASTRKAYPHLRVGCKRGFSYFWHDENEPFATGGIHRNELLVAASESDELADSHWCRSDIDSFLAELLPKYGVSLFEQTEITSLDFSSDRWEIKTQSNDERMFCTESTNSLQCRFVIDASGRARVCENQLRKTTTPNPSQAISFRTDSSAVFAHFKNLIPWPELVDAESQKDHPFRCHDAAVHHVTQSGWMWQLRFHDDVTSCGFCIPNQAAHDQQQIASSVSLQRLLTRFPSLKKQFEKSEWIAPESGITKVDRLQYSSSVTHGPGWISLPNTVGFVDPLHSKGIAHSFSGILRLARRIKTDGLEATFAQSESLTDDFRSEIVFIDRLVSICYRSLVDFRLFRLSTFWYFAAVTRFEAAGMDPDSASGFLISKEVSFSNALSQFEERLEQLLNSGCNEYKIIEFEKWTEDLLRPFDDVGLLQPEIPNMYAKTAAPQKVKAQ